MSSGFIFQRNIDGVKLDDAAVDQNRDLEVSRADAVQLTETADVPLHRQKTDALQLSEEVDAPPVEDLDGVAHAESVALERARRLGGTIQEGSVFIEVNRFLAVAGNPPRPGFITRAFQDALQLGDNVFLVLGDGLVLPLVTTDPSDPGTEQWFLLDPWVAPAAAMEGIVAGFGTPNNDLTGSIHSSPGPSPVDPVIDIVTSGISVANKALFATFTGHGTKTKGPVGGGPVTVVSGAPVDGLKIDFDSPHTIQDLIDAINVWSQANLTPPQNIASLNPGSPFPAGTAATTALGAAAGPGQSDSLTAFRDDLVRIALATPVVGADAYRFNNTTNDPVQSQFAGTGFSWGIQATESGRPGAGVEIHPHVDEGSVNGVSYFRLGLLVLAADGQTIQNIVDAINTWALANLSQTGIATYVGPGGQEFTLASVAFSEDIRLTPVAHKAFMSFNGTREVLSMRVRPQASGIIHRQALRNDTTLVL